MRKKEEGGRRAGGICKGEEEVSESKKDVERRQHMGEKVRERRGKWEE